MILIACYLLIALGQSLQKPSVSRWIITSSEENETLSPSYRFKSILLFSRIDLKKTYTCIFSYAYINYNLVWRTFWINNCQQKRQQMSTTNCFLSVNSWTYFFIKYCNLWNLSFLRCSQIESYNTFIRFWKNEGIIQF